MLLSIRLWLGKKIFGVIGDRTFPAGIRISPRRVVKWHCKMAEAEALRYVATNTTIPVPKLYREHSHSGRLDLEMEFIRGRTLQDCWHTLKDDEKQAIVVELGIYIKQLRGLQSSTKGAISSTQGGPCRDVRVGEHTFGPFQSIPAFHQCLRGGVPLEETREVFGSLVADLHTRDYEVCFTHGDIAAQNILIHRGKIVAILDWECAGWYPEYWEYTKAHYNMYAIPDFYQMLEMQMIRFEDELQAERSLWRMFDQPLDQLGG